MSLTTLSENRERIQKTLPVFRFREMGVGDVGGEEEKKNHLCLPNFFGDRMGKTFIRSARGKQSIPLTHCFSHPSTLSSSEIILIKVCHNL